MADFVFNIAKGAFAEKFRDAAANGIVALATAQEAQSAAVDHDHFTAFWGAAGNTEAADGSYARKTGLTGTVTVDDTNDRVDVDLPDQTWSALDNDLITDAIVAYEEAAGEGTRIPLTSHDFAVQADGSDVTIQFNAAGFGRAS